MGRCGGEPAGRSDFGNGRVPESIFSPAQPLSTLDASLEHRCADTLAERLGAQCQKAC